MNQENVFVYSYSAKVNREVLEIRRKYLREESKLEELRRLDDTVQNAGIAESLCTGISGALLSGLGYCLAAQVIGGGVLCIALGALLGILGFAGMLAAYPIYRKVFRGTKEKFTPRILALAAELSGEGNAF